MRSWRKIKNRVVFYTSNKIYAENFIRLRAEHGFPTRAIVVKPNSSDVSILSWSMSLVSDITKIFQHPNYPRYYPNTVIPMYGTIMNAKFDLLEDAIKNNIFDTEYFAWMDLGLWREFSNANNCRKIRAPPDYDPSKVAMNQVNQFYSNRSISTIISKNEVWVGGGIVFGRKDILLDFIDQYRKTAERML